MMSETDGRPTVPPLQREDVVAPPNSYRPGEPVWIYRYDEWLPGEVGGTSPLAVLVRYEASGGGSAVDTVLAASVARRR